MAPLISKEAIKSDEGLGMEEDQRKNKQCIIKKEREIKDVAPENILESILESLKEVVKSDEGHEVEEDGVVVETMFSREINKYNS